MTKPVVPSYLFITGTGYLAIVQWKLTLIEQPLQQHCIIFTPENTGDDRTSDFHNGLITTVRSVYKDHILSWVPIQNAQAAPVNAEVHPQRAEVVRFLYHLKSRSYILGAVAIGRRKISCFDDVSETCAAILSSVESELRVCFRDSENEMVWGIHIGLGREPGCLVPTGTGNSKLDYEINMWAKSEHQLLRDPIIPNTNHTN
jgi:hypothetical protein